MFCKSKFYHKFCDSDWEVLCFPKSLVTSFTLTVLFIWNCHSLHRLIWFPFRIIFCSWFHAPWSISIFVQQDATQSNLFIILQVHSTCFGWQPHPSSGVYKTVTTASGTGHIFCAATSLQCVQVPTWQRWREVAAQKIWPAPEAVVTVLCTPDDGCGCHPKHVEWTCRIIKRLLCVASRWTIIDVVSFFVCLAVF